MAKERQRRRGGDETEERTWCLSEGVALLYSQYDPKAPISCLCACVVSVSLCLTACALAMCANTMAYFNPKKFMYEMNSLRY